VVILPILRMDLLSSSALRWKASTTLSALRPFAGAGSMTAVHENRARSMVFVRGATTVKP
jgi:hypothetical protein